MAFHAPLPNLPFHSEISNTLYPWKASIDMYDPFVKATGITQSRPADGPNRSARGIPNWPWLSWKTSSAPICSSLTNQTEPHEVHEHGNSLESQIDNAWSTIFVSCRCRSCWPPKSLGPRLCSRRTYDKFQPKLTNFAQVYGSDGPKIFWEMILEDIRRYSSLVNAPGALYGENRKQVLSELLERAESRLEKTTSAWDRRAKLTTPGSKQYLYQNRTRRVPAPSGRGVGGERAVWINGLSADKKRANESLDRQQTRLININGRNLRMRKRHFDEAYLDRKEDQDCARFKRFKRVQRKSTVNSPGHAAHGPGPSPLSQSVTADVVQYQTFTTQQARWTHATLGKISAHASLLASAASLTKTYKWEGMARTNALTILKQLEPRRDLLVRLDEGTYVANTNNDGMIPVMTGERPGRMTTVEMRVQCLKAWLEKMAKEYDTARREFGRGVSAGSAMGLEDIARMSRVNIPGQRDVKSIQALVWQLLKGES